MNTTRSLTVAALIKRMIENRNIICFASNWFYDPTSKHHVMKLLAERNHVIWVNYHGSRRPRLCTADAGAIVAKLRQFVQGPRRVSDNITVITPLVVPMPGVPSVAGLNRRLLTAQIRGVLRSLPQRPVQLWTFAPDIDYMCGRFDEECVVYYCVDEFIAFSGYDAEAIRAAERRLAARADLVVTTSQVLYDAKRPLNDNTFLVTHGVDYDHFASATTDSVMIPADVASLPRPILGFWGLLHDWLDVDLLAEVAAAQPDGSIVLIGEPATDVTALERLPNVHLLGRRPYADLPAYAASFDLGMIPFRINDLTRAVNPIKLREYLSAGLPVVSTPLPEVERYADHVLVAANASEFIEACRTAPGSDSKDRVEARQQAMRRETWVETVEALSRHINARPAQNGLDTSLPLDKGRAREGFSRVDSQFNPPQSPLIEGGHSAQSPLREGESTGSGTSQTRSQSL